LNGIYSFDDFESLFKTSFVMADEKSQYESTSSTVISLIMDQYFAIGLDSSVDEPIGDPETFFHIFIIIIVDINVQISEVVGSFVVFTR